MFGIRSVGVDIVLFEQPLYYFLVTAQCLLGQPALYLL
jgi:hypothetical protein